MTLQVTQPGRDELGHEPRQSGSEQAREGLGEERTSEMGDGQEPASPGRRTRAAMLQGHEQPGQRPRWPRLGQGKVAGVEERKEEEQCLRVTLGLSLHPCPCEPRFLLLQK